MIRFKIELSLFRILHPIYYIQSKRLKTYDFDNFLVFSVKMDNADIDNFSDDIDFKKYQCHHYTNFNYFL
jgi:hypothetical protein